jgi:uncharacterized protein involved in exopolysaccharide biosynthesis
MKWLLHLYPKTWRARYGDEIAALLDESPKTWRTAPDIIAGAFKEQFNMQSFTRLALALSLAGLVAGFLGSFAVTPQFRSQAVFQIERRGGGWQNMPSPAEAIAVAQQNVTSRSSLMTIVANPSLNLYAEERQHTTVEDIEDLMRRNIRITVNPQLVKSSVAVIAFTYKDPRKARDTVNVLISRLVQEVNNEFRESSQTSRPDAEIERIQARLDILEKRLGIVSSPFIDPNRVPRQFLNLLDAPNLPLRPLYPSRPMFAATGFIAGLIAALFIALFRGRYRRPTLNPA